MKNQNSQKTPTSRRIKTEGYSSATLDAKRKSRRLDAEARAEEHNKLTVTDKVTLCNTRRGCSAREIERLTGKHVKSGEDRARFHLSRHDRCVG